MDQRISHAKLALTAFEELITAAGNLATTFIFSWSPSVMTYTLKGRGTSTKRLLIRYVLGGEKEWSAKAIMTLVLAEGNDGPPGDQKRICVAVSVIYDGETGTRTVRHSDIDYAGEPERAFMKDYPEGTIDEAQTIMHLTNMIIAANN